MKFGNAVVRYRIPILILTLILLIPSVFGMLGTRINYDMLTYLPSDMDTMKGQALLKEDFGKGAFTFIVAENMPEKDVAKLKQKIEGIDHVESVLWYDSVADLSIPLEMLPSKLYEAFNKDNCTMMAVFFDSGMSEDGTLEAIRQIRSAANKQCFVSGMSAMVIDLKDLCEEQEPIYVTLAVILAAAAMEIFLDGWLVPFVFLASIGGMIILNLGSNYFFGEISFITKCLAAILQLAVTMDYSIFLWHSYNEQLGKYEDKHDAMAKAISETLTSVVGSSVTTVAGFAALCFMSFTLGKDLGIVMAKGVILGVIGCVTVLPALILVFDKPLQATKHKAILPDMNGFAKFAAKIFPAFLALFFALVPPSYYGYKQTQNEVYYNLAESLPQDLDYAVANRKLSDTFNMASTHMLMVDANLPAQSRRHMIAEMEQVDGVQYVLGMESIVGSRIPEEFLPEKVTKLLRSDDWELMLISSTYEVASNEVNAQVDELNAILKNYDSKGMLIGEAPCMKDLIETTNHDFQVVNLVSIFLIFLIIAIVEKSISLPFILISVIELAIFINLGLPHYLGESLPFIAPICISTIQLGATVDYAILMTTRYKAERIGGIGKHHAVRTALATSIPSIIVSGFGLFAATFGVAVYSDIDMIQSLCMLLARGAIVSMGCVILILPALLLLCDPLICRTTIGMPHSKAKPSTPKEGVLA